ncbi:MAG: protein translocase subunit SecF [Streptosporangiales bacterium]|nr:protein translocase subunit SecF [Streptosporangiales bacterium]
MSRLAAFSQKLHTGAASYDIIGKRKRWFLISLLLILLSIGSLGIKQLNFGVEFSGGSVFQLTAPKATEGQLQKVVTETIREEEGAQGDVIVQGVSGGRWRIQTPSLQAETVTAVQDAIGKEVGIQPDDVSQEQIGPSWGLEVSKKAGLGLGIFLLACVIFLWAVFEWKMAMAAMIALFHDLVITAGVYSLVGFEVSPATVIGFLTILGYSLYDTVVVFDKVRENTAGILGGNRITFSGATNLAVNQTLARSINTSVVALLPVAGILVVSTAIISATTLQDLALALFVGMLAGTYSSIFIASPALTMLKEREPRMISLRRRVEAREAAQGGDGKPKRSRKAKVAASSAAADDAEEPADDEAAAGKNGTVEVDEHGDGKVTVKAASGSSAAKRSGQQQARRGSQRPQPKRGGGSNKRKSKGKKKR